LATGLGRMLRYLISHGRDDLEIVCTDIDKRVLMLTRNRVKSSRKNISFIAADGRYLSIKDDAFDFITSLYAFGNIPETEKVAAEIYRVLKPGGKIVIAGTYIEKDSKSFKLAEQHGLGQGLVEEYLMDALADAKLKNINSKIIAKAEWAENPYDLLPVAGDMNYYCVIEAEKPV
jgi:ubiquinone/menaquinone biosynthesis C-methylase UbiE